MSALAVSSACQKSAQKQRVGLDIGSHTIKGVEVVQHASEVAVRAVGSVRVWDGDRAPDRNALVQATKSLWSSGKFESKDVVLALASEDIYLKWLRIECSDEDELDHLARAAATRGAPFAADDAVTDYRILSRTEQGSSRIYHVMLAAAAASAVEAALDVADRAGLSPLAADVGISAALRSFETDRSSSGTLWSGQPRAHCILGATCTSIGVMRDGALEFARSVPVGGNGITMCIAERLGVDADEAEKIKLSPDTRLTEDGVLLVFHRGEEVQVSCRGVVERLAREIARSLRFFTSQFAEGSYLGMTGNTTLSGGGALLNGMVACLRRNGVEVSGVVNPFSGFSVEANGLGVEQEGERSSTYTTAMGLAAWDQ